ncbi:MAG: hypothetical protein HC808_09295 [Candidatus Competibacteraceae bacterium]|nr:hypothetical protein [Candidatus Competibacteraceae bacterium]
MTTRAYRHHRTNRYNAMVTVGPVAGVWKITALTLLDEQRIDGREALAAANR